MLTTPTAPPRRSRLGFAAVALAVGGGVALLGQRTAYFARTGDDPATRVEFSVDVHNYRHELDQAAASLWYACVGVVNWEAATAPQHLGDNRYEGIVSPSLGEDSTRRFRGCLQDGTVDKVRGTVLRIEGIDLPDDD